MEKDNKDLQWFKKLSEEEHLTKENAMEENASMTKREKYIDSLSKQLKKWDRDLEEFEKKNEEWISDLKQDMSKELENLKTKRSKLVQKMDRLKEVGEDTYKKIKKDTDKLWRDMENGFLALRKKDK